MDRRQLATWAGMVGPTLFVAIFMLEGWLRPGYNSRGMYVSELALGPRGWIQGVNFVVFGVLPDSTPVRRLEMYQRWMYTRRRDWIIRRHVAAISAHGEAV